MYAAKYVSRVGGLAVALGVGTALLTGQGIAYADTSDSGSSAKSDSPTSSESSSQSRGTDSEGARSRPTPGGDGSTSAAGSGEESSSEDPDSDRQPSEPESDAGLSVPGSNGAVDESDVAPKASGRDRGSSAADDAAADRRTAGRSRTTTDRAASHRTTNASTSATGVVDGTDGPGRAVDAVLVEAAPLDTQSAEPAAQLVVAVADTARTAAAQLPTADSSAAVVATDPPSTIASAVPSQPVVSQLLTWTGVTLPAGDVPSTPVPPPAMVAMLASARRELDIDFTGYSTAARPVQPVQPVQTVETAQPLVPVQPVDIFNPIDVVVSLIAFTVTTYVDVTSALQETMATVLMSLVDDLLGHPNDHPAGGEVVISPDDMAPTPYGDIGKWMLQPNGEIADWIRHKFGGRILYEPVNIIIVDPTSTTAEESIQKLNEFMVLAGYGPEFGHTGGYQGLIDGVVYSQQPTTDMFSFADEWFLLPNNHGRVFGPAPSESGTGFIWTAALSRESLGFYDLVPTHVFVSFNRARDGLRDGLVNAGATDLGLVALNNKLDSGTQTTGDHDGYAAVIQI